jgi:hypothetical protein
MEPIPQDVGVDEWAAGDDLLELRIRRDLSGKLGVDQPAENDAVRALDAT